MVFNTEGRPLQGITGGNGSERRVEFIFKDPTYSQTYYIEVSANGKLLYVTEKRAGRLTVDPRPLWRW